MSDVSGGRVHYGNRAMRPSINSPRSVRRLLNVERAGAARRARDTHHLRSESVLSDETVLLN